MQLGGQVLPLDASGLPSCAPPSPVATGYRGRAQPRLASKHTPSLADLTSCLKSDQPHLVNGNQVELQGVHRGDEVLHRLGDRARAAAALALGGPLAVLDGRRQADLSR